MSVNLFSDVMSVYYGRKYFGEEAKTDVTGMIDKISRTSPTEWLVDGRNTRNKLFTKVG